MDRDYSENVGVKKGKWTAEEDDILVNYIQSNGEGSWNLVPEKAGLLRCGRSCRLRWINYLKPGLKRGNFSIAEETIIVQLHSTLGNRWSEIAAHLPGRTDNEIKNYYKCHLKRKIYCFRHTCNILRTTNANMETVVDSTSKKKSTDQVPRKRGRPKGSKKETKPMPIDQLGHGEISGQQCCSSGSNSNFENSGSDIWDLEPIAGNLPRLVGNNWDFGCEDYLDQGLDGFEAQGDIAWRWTDDEL